VQNAVCRDDIYDAGLHICSLPKNGNFIGAKRGGGSNANFYVAELRAYEGVPLIL
jgi:hypothetical protein